MHRDHRRLEAAIPIIREYLDRELQLTLHPRKVYLQPAYRGVQYLGVVIKPGRITIANRTKGNFAAAVGRFNRLAEARKPTADERARFQSSINSYLGILRHYATLRLRWAMLCRISPWWLRHFHLNPQKISRYTNHERPFLLLQGRSPHETEAEQTRRGVTTRRSIG